MRYKRAKAPYLTEWHAEAQKHVKMSPQSFLRLTLPPYMKKGKLKSESFKALKQRMKKGLPIDPLFMDIDVELRRVVAHEGRTRALAAKSMGIKKVPVILYFKKGQTFIDASKIKLPKLKTIGRHYP